MQAIKKEIKKLSSLFIFFFIGFGYILLLMKLFLRADSIDIYVLSKAFLGAIIAAKTVAILDTTPWLQKFSRGPRYLNVIYKTAIYTVFALIIGLLEDLIHNYLHTKNLSNAIAAVLETEHFSHFLAVTLCIAIVFLMHNIFTEIDRYLGKGRLFKFFFERP